MTNTKLYTRDEVQKLSHKAITRAMKRTLHDITDGDDVDPLMAAAIGLSLVKMAASTAHKLAKLLDKAEGKK